MTRIAVVGTGGTIASTTTVTRSYALPDLGPAEILAQVGQLDYDVETVDLFHEGSSALTTEHVQGVVAEVRRRVADGCDAVVITQGTATLPETAYLYDLLLGDEALVAITGAMRPASDLSPDGPVNLRDALLFVAQSVGARRGVHVIMNGEVHAPVDVLKLHGASPAGFVSPGVGVLGWVDAGEVRMRRERRRRTQSISGLVKRVELLAAALDASTLQIDFLASDQTSAGLVIAGFPGRGAVPPSWMPAVRKYVASGRPLVFTVTSLTGRALPRHGPEGTTRELAEAGAIVAGDLAPIKARCLLMALLSETRDVEVIRTLVDDEMRTQ